VSGVLQVKPSYCSYTREKKIWIFLWPQFQMSQGCFVWSRFWTDISAHV